MKYKSNFKVPQSHLNIYFLPTCSWDSPHIWFRGTSRTNCLSFELNPTHILPACTTATAHTFAFEFDLVMDLMAIFSNKQAEVSTGEKTYGTTVYKVSKHIAWSKHAVKSWLYVEHPVEWMLFAWHFFNHLLDTENWLSTTTMRWLGKPQQKTNLLSVSIHSTILYHQ